ncbi:WD40 repeat-like protein [Aspergillus violaceofuscus CBS 115571]|uniref:WD40 repeat-like protein n=1 Tax=Aspergillus violaceofuscus (strain CBS 115571) TaxID=1450538 RepID=A0A2V5HH58_ASPV1|nr:WD40 repeat-like protein [Aspergillus violaceofuscus CBS 115571]
MIEYESTTLQPLCVATSTKAGIEEQSPRTETHISSQEQDDRTGGTPQAASRLSDSNIIKSAEWSADGTTLLTDSTDHHIRSYILPPDLLEERPSPIHLSPYSTLASAEPIYATAMYPFFSLQDPSTTLFLSSVRDHPIRLASALAPMQMASYSLVNPMTEAFITPHSMIYPPSLGGTQFLTGSDSLICLFDVSRPGNDGPVTTMPTIPSKRKQVVGGGVGMKGIVSALAVDPSAQGILAAGTFTRHVGLYDSHGSGQSLGTFSIAKTEADPHIGGCGITQLLWSPCGRYLYVAERKSDGVLVYDIRVTGQLLGWLQGRKALTNQRMKIDVVATGQGDSHEIWAGGTDGCMRVWQNPTYNPGAQEPKWEWKAHDESVSSTVVHPLGNVAATTSGQRYFADEPDDGIPPSNSQIDRSLKVWYMPFLNDSNEIDSVTD